jgi:hypothetical protein
MLNYFEVTLKGSKDEKLNKKELDTFIDKFWRIHDLLTVQDIIEKLKQKRKDEFPPPSDEDAEEDEDWMLPPKEESEIDDDFFGKVEPKKESKENLSDPISTDINKFLRWLTIVLYSGNHSVIISEDTSGIYIKLIKINKDKGKK